jgi:hypothetical protein
MEGHRRTVDPRPCQKDCGLDQGLREDITRPRNDGTIPRSRRAPYWTNTNLRSRLGGDKSSPYVGEGFMPSRKHPP